MCKVSPICICLSLVVAFILAAILAVLFFFGIAPLFYDLIIIAIPIVATVLIGLTILLLIASKHQHGDLAKCLCCFAKGILILAIILFVLSIIAFGFNLYPSSILDAVIVFFQLLFMFSLIFYVAAFIWCLIVELCRRPCRSDNN